MKYLLIISIAFNSFVFASNTDDNAISKRQIKKQMEREKKYAKEQTFYNSNNYDFKGAEVEEESLKNIKAIEVEDFDMDSVYD
jgi:hypothetical protein